MLRVREGVLSGESGFIGRVEAADLSGVLEDVDVLYVGVPAGERFEIAAAAVRAGVHAFLEWPPAVSLRECAELVELAEEAGIEIGVSRPLRFHSSFAESEIARIVSMRMASVRRNLLHELSDLADLASVLVGSSSVQRIDAETVASAGLNPVTAFDLRFDNGAYVQGLVHGASSRGLLSVFAAGRSMEWVVEVERLEDLVATETRRFLNAIDEDAPIPVSAYDALQTMRIVERLMGNLR